MNTKETDLEFPPKQAIADSQPIPTVPPSKTRQIFLGPQGLRAGWGILIFITSFASLMIVANHIGHRLHHTHAVAGVVSQGLSLTSTLINASIPFFAALLISWMMSKIERRPNSAYGLVGHYALPDFLAGLAWGVTLLSLLVFALHKTGLLIIDTRLLFGPEILRYGAPWLLGFVMIGLFEEYLFRGYLLFTLSRGLAAIYERLFDAKRSKAFGFWTAALALSSVFGLGHNSNAGESPIGLLTAGLFSLVCCLSLWRTGSLWWAIGFHATWDWSQSFLYGVADSGTMIRQHVLTTHAVGRLILSGGATGPEGSIYMVGVLTLISATIVFTLPRRAVESVATASY